MPLRRKHQIAAKIETAEGTDAWGGGAPAAADLITVFEPDVQDGVELQERPTSGATLSQGFDSVGRETRTITFRSDFKGNTTGGTTADKRNALPPWDGLLRASAFTQVQGLKFTGTFAGGPFFIGERVGHETGGWTDWATDGEPDNWGYAIQGSSGAELLVIPVKGDLASETELHGEQSAASITTATVANESIGYLPTSVKTATITVGAYSSGDPSAGEVVRVLDASDNLVGSAILLDVSTMTAPVFSLFYGTIANGYKFERTNGSKATASTDATAVATPSVSVFSNLDTLERRALGCRGDFTLGAEVGEVFEFSWTFQGGSVAAVDADQVTGGAVDSLQGPRFQGATLGVGWDRDGTGDYFNTCAPIKSFEYSSGNTVEDRRTPCTSTGVRGANVTARDPQVTIEVDQAGLAALDWFDALRNARGIRLAFAVGSSDGNYVGVVAANAQLVEISDSESDGLATHSLTFRLRKFQDSGDDEVAFFKY